MGRLYTIQALVAELLDLPEEDVRGRYRVYRAINREVGSSLAALRHVAKIR